MLHEPLTKYPGQEYMYNWPTMNVDFNNLDKNLIQKISPTDSRFRTDQKALEYREIKLAGSEKHRLEVNQRARRKFRNDNEIEHVPHWFEAYTDEDTGDESWVYKGGYWETRFEYHARICAALDQEIPDLGISFNISIADI